MEALQFILKVFAAENVPLANFLNKVVRRWLKSGTEKPTADLAYQVIRCANPSAAVLPDIRSKSLLAAAIRYHESGDRLKFTATLNELKATIKRDSRAIVALYNSLKDTQTLEKAFRGTFMSHNGEYPFRFILILRIKKHPTRNYSIVVGTIDWTLLDAPPTAAYAQRIGQTAQERVAGTYDAQSGSLRFSGYELGPGAAGLIAIDDYDVKLSANEEMFTGFTRGHAGTWRNPFNARRL